MRIRTIKPEFWSHPVMAKLPDDWQLLALGLLSAADDEGYFRADPSIIRGEVCPFRENLARIREGLLELSRVGWVILASHPEQGEIGRISKWEKHQRVDHPSPSKLKCYFLASNSRESREVLAPDQGTGNREQGTGNGSPCTVELPRGFPETEHEAKQHAAFVGCPEDFAGSTWNNAMGRGGVDAKGQPIRQWRNHLAAMWKFAQNREQEQKAQRSVNANQVVRASVDRNAGTYNEGRASDYAYDKLPARFKPPV